MADRKQFTLVFFTKQIQSPDVLSTMLRAFLFLALVASPAFAADNALRNQVDALFKQRQWAEAQSLLEKVTVAEPTNAESWHLLGQAYLNAGDAEKATGLLEKATSLDSTNSEYQRILGDAYGLSALRAGIFSKLGFAKKCKAAYDKSVELDPANIKARWSVMEFCRQAPGFIGGGMGQAYVQAEAIRKLDPAQGRVALATLYVADKKIPEAFALFNEALRSNPDDYATLYQTGRLAAMSGQQLELGLTSLRKCLTLAPAPAQPGHPPVNWRIGNILERQGDKTGARAAYESAVAEDPKFVPAVESLRKIKEG